MLRGLSVCVLSAGRVGTGDCVVASVMLVLWVLMIEQYWALLSFFGAVLSCIERYRAALVQTITSEDGWSRSEAVVSTVGGHYMESHATKSHTRLNGRMVCVWLACGRAHAACACAWDRCNRVGAGMAAGEWK